MAISFLRKALPQIGSEIKIATKSIRGNVESRLRQLDEGNYDGTILATAGLNRLLQSETDKAVINELLRSKKKMLLPLFECVPAPCQGAIVVEAHDSNSEANTLLNKINDPKLFEEAFNEKKEGYQYGTGCLQKFGVATLHTQHGNFMYAAGEDTHGHIFQKWVGLPEETYTENLFSSTDHMKDFFTYSWSQEEINIPQPVVFVANYKSASHSIHGLNKSTIIASGTKTWLELAKQGKWVIGCADGMGFEFLLPALKMPVINIQPEDICVLTHRNASERWKQKGYASVSNYALRSTHNEAIIHGISNSDFIFWSSYAQYESYKQYAKPSATHMCAGGETASLLKRAGVLPIIFPTIKSFEQWRKFSIPSLSED